jgi:UDP-2,3-diacylglucosamine pyrophosphatase LpxH
MHLSEEVNAMSQRFRAGGRELKVVVSDLHLGDGNAATENWQPAQKAAWGELLARMSADAAARSVELIVNGDAFDLLAAEPALGERDETDVAMGTAKIAAVVAAHMDWFASLLGFLAHPEHTLTFTIGNHDAELAFAAVRAQIRQAIGAREGAVRFCLTRAYRPLPDVALEHGCQTDPWNRIPDLWDASTDRAWAAPEDLEAIDVSEGGGPERLRLPWGSRYYYRVFRPIQQRFPYFDAFLPTLPQPGVLGLLCLFAPELVVSGSARAQTLRADPMAMLPSITPAVMNDPAQLYAAILPDVAGLQSEISQRAGIATGPEELAAALEYAMAIHAGLEAGELEALRAIFAVPGLASAATTTAIPADDAAAATAIFAHEPSIRLGLIGHTHVEGMYTLPRTRRGHRTLVNTGTWYTRLALPRPRAVNAALGRWLRDPLASPTPLAAATAFTYAVIHGGAGAPSSVGLATVAPREG